MFGILNDLGQLIISSRGHSVTSGNQAAREFKEWINLERAGKNKIEEAVRKTFLSGVFDRNPGFTYLRVRYIATHLFTEYGQVEKQDLIGNCVMLSEPWDANTPFQELVQRVQ